MIMPDLSWKQVSGMKILPLNIYLPSRSFRWSCGHVLYSTINHKLMFY